MTIINEEKKYRELKESIKMMNSQRNDTEKNNLIEEGKKIDINGPLSNLGIRAPLSKGPLSGDILFYKYKMNEIVYKFLLAGDKFVSEMHLKQPRFTYSACGPFTKNKERIQNLKKQEIQTIFTKMNLIKLVFNMIWHMEILKI